MRHGVHAILKLKSKTPKIKLQIYNALVQSYLAYGSGVWNTLLNKKHLKRMEMVQKAGVRTILKLKRTDHTDSKFKELGILNAKDLIKKDILANYITLKHPKNKNNNLSKYVNVNSGKTRQAGSLKSHIHAPTLLRQIQVINGNLNLLQSGLSKKTTLSHFSNSLLEEYSDKCIGPGCVCGYTQT